MEIDKEMISELVAAAFAARSPEDRGVITIELLSEAVLDAQRSRSLDKLKISIPPSKYILGHLLYKGKDGHDYETVEALFDVNQRWMEINYPKIVRDPRFP